MYSPVSYQIAQDRIADMHRQARSRALARAGRPGRLSHKGQSGHHELRPPAVAVRRLVTAAGTHA